jgi:hypothetical protein
LCKENNDDININVNKRAALESSVKTLDSTMFSKKMRYDFMRLIQHKKLCMVFFPHLTISISLCVIFRNQFVNFSEGMTLQREEHVIRIKNNSGTFQGDAIIKPGIQDGEPDSILQSRVPLSVLSHENLANSRQSGFPSHSSPYHAFSAIKRPMQQGLYMELMAVPIILFYKVLFLQ